VRRRYSLIVTVLLVALVGSWATWASAIQAVAHGAHHISFRWCNGRAAIVLQHEHREASHPHAHAHDDATDAAATTSDHDRDHVVVLPGSDDSYSRPSLQQLPHDGGPAIPFAASIDFATPDAPLVPCVACSRVGPPVPSRSNILRI